MRTFGHNRELETESGTRRIKKKAKLKKAVEINKGNHQFIGRVSLFPTLRILSNRLKHIAYSGSMRRSQAEFFIYIIVLNIL